MIILFVLLGPSIPGSQRKFANSLGNTLFSIGNRYKDRPQPLGTLGQIVLRHAGELVVNLDEYTELMAESGAQAISLLDVVMPGMGGRRLAERVLQILPSIRVLFTSGYTENAIVHNGRLDAGVELLSKPYDRERLTAKLRRVLDRANLSS